jgi:hypothetical protein
MGFRDEVKVKVKGEGEGFQDSGWYGALQVHPPDDRV